MEYILLLVGFILLIKGADFFVEGSSSLAGILKVPSVIIGLTIVAMGTSAPEASSASMLRWLAVMILPSVMSSAQISSMVWWSWVSVHFCTALCPTERS